MSARVELSSFLHVHCVDPTQHCIVISDKATDVTIHSAHNMALRSGLATWGRAWKLAAGLTVGSASYALCEDIRGPSFDPEALERGAKALREINTSPYAKKVISDHCRSANATMRSSSSVEHCE